MQGLGCQAMKHPRFCHSWFLNLTKSGLWGGLPMFKSIQVGGKLESKASEEAAAKVFMVISLSGREEGQPCWLHWALSVPVKSPALTCRFGYYSPDRPVRERFGLLFYRIQESFFPHLPGGVTVFMEQWERSLWSRHRAASSRTGSRLEGWSPPSSSAEWGSILRMSKGPPKILFLEDSLTACDYAVSG